MVLSASYARAYYSAATGHNAAYYFMRQLGFALAGVGAMYALSLFPMQFYRRMSFLVLAAAAGLLALVPVIGVSQGDAKALDSLGFTTFQPLGDSQDRHHPLFRRADMQIQGPDAHREVRHPALRGRSAHYRGVAGHGAALFRGNNHNRYRRGDALPRRREALLVRRRPHSGARGAGRGHDLLPLRLQPHHHLARPPSPTPAAAATR